MVGEFEYLILSAAAHLGEEAYGAAMREVIETTGGGPVRWALSTSTLDRLEAKGLVETWMSAPTQQRGGRAKRMVRVTGEGVRAAREFYTSCNSDQPRNSLGRGPAQPCARRDAHERPGASRHGLAVRRSCGRIARAYWSARWC